MNRRNRFLFGFILVTSFFSLPIIIAASVNAFQWLAILLACYSVGVYQIYRMTMKNIRLKYPLVNPEAIQTSIQDECPDQYTKTQEDTLGSSKRNARQSRKKKKSERKTEASNNETRPRAIQTLLRICNGLSAVGVKSYLTHTSFC